MQSEQSGAWRSAAFFAPFYIAAHGSAQKNRSGDHKCQVGHVMLTQTSCNNILVVCTSVCVCVLAWAHATLERINECRNVNAVKLTMCHYDFKQMMLVLNAGMCICICACVCDMCTTDKYINICS